MTSRILVSMFLALLFGVGSSTLFGQEVDADYQISAGDVVTLNTFKDPEGSNKTLRVSRKGMIEHPYLGSFRISGLTASQAARKLEGALRGDYLVNPRVNITVVDFTKMTILVLGAVNAPGSFTVPANTRTTLLEAIAKAGDFKDVANKKRVQLLRRIDGRMKPFVVNVKALLDDSNRAPIYLKDGDTIRVKESFLF